MRSLRTELSGIVAEASQKAKFPLLDVRNVRTLIRSDRAISPSTLAKKLGTTIKDIESIESDIQSIWMILDECAESLKKK